MDFPEDWLEVEQGEDFLESRAFYELMQSYRFSTIIAAAENFEAVKQFIRTQPQNTEES